MEYVVRVWFAGQTAIPDEVVTVIVSRVVTVEDVAQGVLKMVGEWFATHVSVTDALSKQTTLLKDVVLDV